MNAYKSETSIRGRLVKIPTARIQSLNVVAVGRWLRIASVKDEYWLNGKPMVDPRHFIDELRGSGLKADIFTYSGSLEEQARTGALGGADRTGKPRSHSYERL